MSSALSSDSTDPISAARAVAVERIVEAVRGCSIPNPTVLIDGRSGAAKTTLAGDLIAHWPLDRGVQLVALDSIYPGWDGLAKAAAIARDRILAPHAHGVIGVWQRWDWAAACWAESHAVDPTLPLIVEGSGILTPETALLSDVRVWIESPAASRKERALARDGETYRPYWDRWAAQEERHIELDNPQQHATIRVELP